MKQSKVRIISYIDKEYKNYTQIMFYDKFIRKCNEQLIQHDTKRYCRYMGMVNILRHIVKNNNDLDLVWEAM